MVRLPVGPDFRAPDCLINMSVCPGQHRGPERGPGTGGEGLEPLGFSEVPGHGQGPAADAGFSVIYPWTAGDATSTRCCPPQRYTARVPSGTGPSATHWLSSSSCSVC